MALMCPPTAAASRLRHSWIHSTSASRIAPRATPVEGDNETVIVDHHRVTGVMIFVSVHGEHRWYTGRDELLPHFVHLHRPVIIAVHEQKNGLNSRRR